MFNKKKAFSEYCETFVDSSIPEVRVVGGDRLRDARVKGADAGLGGGAKVSVALITIYRYNASHTITFE